MLRILDPNTFTGNQVAIVSDRFVFNAQAGDIILAAKGSIVLGSMDEIHINSKSDIYLNVSGSSRIILGTPTDKRTVLHPMVLGGNLFSFIQDIISILSTFKVDTPSGPGTVNGDSFSKIGNLYKTYLTEDSDKYIGSQYYYLLQN